MTNLQSLLESIETARNQFITTLQGLTQVQINYKTNSEEWCILEIAEHITLAEQVGLNGMFKAVEGLKSGQPIWEGESPNAGLSIEQIVANTWQNKEKVPEVAKPRWGGSLKFWIAALQNNRHLVEELRHMITDIDPHKTIYPHPISGPMDVVQRLEFLRFHLERHTAQIERIKSGESFLN